jgi:predicted nuclease with TOPRIM domain
MDQEIEKLEEIKLDLEGKNLALDAKYHDAFEEFEDLKKDYSKQVANFKSMKDKNMNLIKKNNELEERNEYLEQHNK